jgi:hypothetical protein
MSGADQPAPDSGAGWPGQAVPAPDHRLVPPALINVVLTECKPSFAAYHAAVFGMTEVLDVLVAAGARIDSLEMAAAAGNITGWPLTRLTLQSRIRALVFAADHQRLEVIDQLVAAGTPVNEPDAEWGRLPLHTAAGNGLVASVRRLLTHGADPSVRDPQHNRTPLEESQRENSPAHREVEAILRQAQRDH